MVAQFPIMTFASGPTNSMRGAAFLSGVSDGIVVDIGGTTTDIGVLVDGFPRPAALAVDIAGVRTNFRMPDLYSFGLGGGSIVWQEPLRIGPDSVGYRLQEEALAFGGSQLTASDIAVAAGLAEFGDSDRVRQLDSHLVAAAKETMAVSVASAVDRMKRDAAPVPVVLVGGGSVLISDTLDGASELIRPNNFAVANAVGAALMQVGGEVDRIVRLDPARRDEILSDISAEARAAAVAAGAQPDSVIIHTIDTIPLAYLPGNATRVHIKAIGDLML